ncbi:MAG: hypothetical protein E6K18_03095 [Methanobacteriota archaeon]|nr:MAG: hypothetical protein E6K18_03095 [Euryarchaeota archaeon]
MTLGKRQLALASTGTGLTLLIAGPILALALGLPIPLVVVPAVLGFVFMMAGGVLYAMDTEARPAAAVPRDPIALTCPNCGGAAQSIVASGIATCAYCGTRFRVS